MVYGDPVMIQEVTLPDGFVLPVEVTVRAGDVSGLTDQLRLDHVRDTFAEVGQWISGTIRKTMPERPETVEVTFGMKLAVESGKVISILAKANAEASFTVKMTWNLSPNDEPAAADQEPVFEAPEPQP